ncbi:MAG: acyltransferase [Actinomycetota bacterium]|nr:acyltransferase [Actinomycetota bacterium]
MRLPPAPPVAQAVAATPPARDRVLDLMRAAALTLVVLGHATMGLVGWRPDGPVVSNTLTVYPWAAWATWGLQIMPLFFVAGGAVNARSWRAGRAPYAPWLWGRVARLLRPVWAYLLIMAPLSALVSRVAPEGWSAPLLGLATQLLWFIGAYVMVVALTPLAVAAHRRSPLLGPMTLLGAIVVVDVARLGLDLPSVLGLLNFVTVWAFAAQLGLLFDDGYLRGPRGALLAAVAVLTNLALVSAGPYPTSMVGLTGEDFSNMAPPSLVLALHALTLAGVVGAARPALGRLAAHARVWSATTAINLTAMTLYLWHLPVLIAVVAIEHLVGLDRPVRWLSGDLAVPGPGFWLWTVPYFVVYLACVAGAVRLMWPVELGTLPGWDRPARTEFGGAAKAEHRSAALAALGAALIGSGTLALAATGLAGFPTRVTYFAGVPLNAVAAIGLMVGGGLLIRHAGSDTAAVPTTNGKQLLN